MNISTKILAANKLISVWIGLQVVDLGELEHFQTYCFFSKRIASLLLDRSASFGTNSWKVSLCLFYYATGESVA